MWQFQILLLVLGSSPLWVIAEEVSTTLPEDGITTADSSNANPYNSEDAPTLLPTTTTRIHYTTGFDEDQSTTEATAHSRENSTDSRVTTDHPSEGLETVALVGIILGIVIAIGIIAGIVIAVVRKMSGRP
ncbi:podoplanin isoform X5 [Dromiciops gliroides]|uniref:podoplanin isoform X5 n=1 Tax=Dromiciops gliroides TaxID=33562 RepID=UPI001CC54E95|nr:podoplanin isoform X5 [Dromiciops gliroides]